MTNRVIEPDEKKREILSEMDTCESGKDDMYLNYFNDDFPDDDCNFLPLSSPYKSRKGLARYGNAAKHLLPFRRSKMEKNRLSIDDAGIFSLLTFSWISKYIYQAYKKGLTFCDIPGGSPFDLCDLNSSRLEAMWYKELNSMGLHEACFGDVIWQFVRTRILISCLVFALSCIIGFLSSAIFMRKLLEYLEDPNESEINGVIWALALTGSELLKTMLMALYYSLSFRTSSRLEAACLGLVYRKILKLKSARNTSIGEIIHLYTLGFSGLSYVVKLTPLIIGGPILLICGLIYIYHVLGSWAMLGMLVFLAYYLIQFLISYLNYCLKKEALEESSGRIKLMMKILTHIKLIKLCALENWFSSRIHDIRRRELAAIKKTAYHESVGISLAPTVPAISVIVTFLVHVAAGGNLTAAQAFPVLAFASRQLRLALSQLHLACTSIAQGSASIPRFKAVLLLEEKAISRVSRQLDTSLALVIKDGCFSWGAVDVNVIRPKKDEKDKDKEEEGEKEKKMKKEEKETVAWLREKLPKVLDSINLTVRKGALIGVCGPVGSGKSSLLLACLGQLKTLSGKVTTSGSYAYVSQQSWMENTSVKENILFGEKFDAEKYSSVVSGCCLSEDINFLPDGDETKVGINGANLSGGQKQRLSLARALYSERDIYLLDDPFSAVDSQVAVQLFENCVLGALEEKTVILVTRQIQFLEKCDEILVLKKGHIVERGTYAELVSNGKEFDFMIQSNSSQRSVEKGEDDAKKSEGCDAEMNHEGENCLSKGESPPAKKPTVKKAEEQRKVTVRSSTYRAYVKAAGGYLVAFTVIMMIFFNVGTGVFSSWWLAMWIKAGSGNTTVVDPATNETVISRNIGDNPKLPFYMQVYGSIIGLVVATCIIRGFTFTKVTIRASRNLHHNLFNSVIKSPMTYFERTPIGRIQNLFSKDLNEVDTLLRETMETMLQNLSSVIFAILSITLVIPWFLIPLTVFGCVYYFVRKIWRVAIRDLERINNTCRGSVFSLISETVQGLPTIHAFNREKYFMSKFSKLFDENLTVQFMLNCSKRWITVRLDFISVAITFVISFLVIFLKGEIAPAFSALAVTYAAQICGIFQFTVRLMNSTEVQFISVERIQNSIEKLSPEGNTETTVKVEADWPAKGKIEFEDVVLSYGESLPQVLNGISLSIRGGEKIGVVGRTGAGKSSLAVALFRLVELTSGRIIIDGVNIANVPLSVLRSRLSVIPQDPVLLNDTLRSNLDPLNQFPDSHIWQVLHKTKLSSKVKSLPQQLDSHVDEGENFSVGERQLVCLARLLLRRSKVLILDEATASIDPETEVDVQTAILEEFKNCTVITIAHRLSTVTSCDRVLVMDHGTVLEFDDPRVLAENPQSQFAKMLAASEV